MDGRPMWELKAIALLLAASAGVAVLFGVITKQLFDVIFLAVFNYFMANASGSKIDELIEKLVKLKQAISFYAVDKKIKLVFAGFSVLAVIFFYLKLIDYDTTIKILQAFAILLMANFGWLEYKLSKL